MSRSGTFARLSPRNLALIEAVKDRYRLDVTETKLERWRGWRGVGLVPRSAPGTRTRWRAGLADEISESELAWVAEAARLAVRFPRSLDRVALALSARGYPVDAGAVKEAFLAWYEHEAVRPARVAETRRAWIAAGLPDDASEILAWDHRAEGLRPSGAAMRDHVEAVRHGKAKPVGADLIEDDVLTIEQERSRLEAATGAGVVYALGVGYGYKEGLEDRDVQTLHFAHWYLVYGSGKPEERGARDVP